MTRTVDGWVLLAAAIIKSGEKCHDESFLKSKWCDELKSLVELYVDENNKRLEENNTVWSLYD